MRIGKVRRDARATGNDFRLVKFAGVDLRGEEEEEELNSDSFCRDVIENGSLLKIVCVIVLRFEKVGGGSGGGGEGNAFESHQTPAVLVVRE